eukprot:CAMPEP_0205821864 /NCGR_PEP_ID=MMETSP0206-20130828/9805_1 /ASSEMBLY_ACC=CAM_ASM_000279 /TAXON_ID=36767 /ORGANISM="Euplotes focardii, Strain TN1" /LENGTH=74 /DNA_ID=CAMNT_0053117675 /DNA_START=10 /DNA_END=234 /DNA_ORIENTATION=+
MDPEAEKEVRGEDRTRQLRKKRQHGKGHERRRSREWCFGDHFKAARLARLRGDMASQMSDLEHELTNSTIAMDF